MTDTVVSALARTASEWGTSPAVSWKDGGIWRSLNWSEFSDIVSRTACGLVRHGFEPGDGLVILSNNRPEWVMADLAAIAAGGVPTGLYTTATADQCSFVTNHCEATAAVVENGACLELLGGARDRLKIVVLLDGPAEEGCLTWQELMDAGDDDAVAEVKGRGENLNPDDVCTLIYTSGTTGSPKGVMLSHHNLLWTARRLATQLDVDSSHRNLSYLPLSHVAEQVVSVFAPIVTGGCVAFAESLEVLGENLREVRPTFFLGVPRVWEKIQARMQAVGARSGPVKRHIARWACRVGLSSGYASQRGDGPSRGYGLADRLVFAKVRRRLGFDRAKFFATAAAPISLDTLEFFLSLGMPLIEVYGMTECSGPGTLSTPTRFRTGSAGFAVPGTELKLAEDGEILMRGPHVFVGYYKDREATREALDADGWLHSGDIGTLDEDGFLKVVDRKKEIIVTSGGKNIAPVPIELQLKSIPAVAQAVVVGERRKFLTALLALDSDQVSIIAGSIGSAAIDAAGAATCARFQAYLEEEVARVNANLSSYEGIKKFAVLAEQLSVEAETLTPTLKLRRRNIVEFYRREIDELYAEA